MRRILLFFSLLLLATAPCGAAPSKDAAKPPLPGATLSGSMAAPGASSAKAEPACWFYLYQWAKYAEKTAQGSSSSYSVPGFGTGLAVTEGLPPTDAQAKAIEEAAVSNIPREKGVPPPYAKVKRFARTDCPKGWESIPGVPASLLKWR